MSVFQSKLRVWFEQVWVELRCVALGCGGVGGSPPEREGGEGALSVRGGELWGEAERTTLVSLTLGKRNPRTPHDVSSLHLPDVKTDVDLIS